MSVYIGLEAEVRSIRTFEGLLVPGLLQTEQYARSVIRLAAESAAVEEDIERWVKLRTVRQEQLTGDNPLQLWAIVDEVALRRPVGGYDVMREQLQHIATMAGHSNVTLQVIPVDAGEHVGLEGPFVLLEFPDPEDHDVAYVESRSSGLFLEDSEKVRGYCQLFEHLRATALSPAESAALVWKMTEGSA